MGQQHTTNRYLPKWQANTDVELDSVWGLLLLLLDSVRGLFCPNKLLAIDGWVAGSHGTSAAVLLRLFLFVLSLPLPLLLPMTKQ